MSYYIGDTCRIKHIIVDAEGEFLSGESPTLTVIKDSDGYYYDFVSGAFVNTGGTSTQALTEDSDNEYYYSDWTPPISEIANETYLLKIQNTGDYADISIEDVRYVEEPAKDSDTAKESTLTIMKQSSGATFDRETDSLQAIRDRGDVAWRQAALKCVWSPENVENVFKRFNKLVDDAKKVLEILQFVSKGEQSIKSLEKITELKDISESFNEALKNILLNLESIDGNGSTKAIKALQFKLNEIESGFHLSSKLLARMAPDRALEEVLKNENRLPVKRI